MSRTEIRDRLIVMIANLHEEWRQQARNAKAQERAAPEADRYWGDGNATLVARANTERVHHTRLDLDALQASLALVERMDEDD